MAKRACKMIGMLREILKVSRESNQPVVSEDDRENLMLGFRVGDRWWGYPIRDMLWDRLLTKEATTWLLSQGGRDALVAMLNGGGTWKEISDRFLKESAPCPM